MSDKQDDGSFANAGDTEDLLRELIPGETPSTDRPDDELPHWSGVSAEEAAAGNVPAQAGAPLSAARPSQARPSQAQPALLQEHHPEQRQRGRSRLFWILSLGLGALLLVGLAFGIGVTVGSDSNSDSDETDAALTDGVDDEASGEDSDDGAESVASPTTEAEPTPSSDEDSEVAGSEAASNLTLSLRDYAFTLEGVVPSEGLKDAIEMRMGLVFAEFGTSNLAVDPAAASAPWLEGAPSLINTMILLHEGTIEITEDAVNVSGRALQSDFDKLQGALSADRGFPPISISDQEIVDKEAPWFRAVASGDVVTVTGELADETMQSTLVEGAKAIYGQDNVTDQTSVNPERHNRFLIMRFPSNLAAYKVFGEFDIRGENELFIAILESGLEFEILETELTSESQERLSNVMFTLTRNPLPVTVVGHTDGVGSSVDNQALSEARAESVAAFLIENGVLQENITVSGRGESEPISDNRSQDGRARNRRVEISVGLDN